MGVPNLKNRVGMTVSGTPGTGAITLNAADTGYQSFASAYGANANVDVLIVDGSAWEVARDCTYTHSGTTLSRGTLEASSTGSAVSLTSAAKVYVTETAERMRRGEMGYLEHVSHDGSAAVTGVVGTLHVFTGLTADRVFTLPASAAAGDRVGVTFPAGSASYEIQLKSASGDKINNVDCSTTEWSRLFIAGETVIFRCIDAGTVDWIVEYDGRIPQSGQYTATGSGTNTQSINAATWTKLAAATMSSETFDNCACIASDGTNIRAVARRAGLFCLKGGTIIAGLSDQKESLTGIYVNAGASPSYRTDRKSASGSIISFTPGFAYHAAAADDYFTIGAYHTDTVARETNDSAGYNVLAIQEIL